MTLPDGFVARLGPQVAVIDDGRALLGGAPTRLLKLSPLARGLLEDREIVVRDRPGAILADRLIDLGIADPVVDRLPGHPGDYTVVVPVRDRPAQLDRLLASVEPGRPVVVVDDASRHPAAVAEVARRRGARLVALDENAGPGAARNAGLAEVRTPFVVFADSDVVLDPETVPLLLRHFADPRVAMAAPRIEALDPTGNWIARYEQARSSLDLGRHSAAVRPRTPVSWVSAACLVARVDALGSGFDPGMRVGEDVDLCWRLDRAGWRVRYEPAARARHEHRSRLMAWMGRKAVYGTGAQPLAERHPENIAPAVLAPWSAAALLALLAQRRWSIPAAGAITAVATLRIASRLRGTPSPLRRATRLSTAGLAGSIVQGFALLLRHWWPLTAVVAPFSRRIRRAVAVAAVVDVAIEYRRTNPDLDPVRFGVARRLDDLAYGAGVWFAALRARSIAALIPLIRATDQAGGDER